MNYPRSGFETEPVFQLIVEAAPNAMLMVDNAGKIALVNHGTEILFGYNREELIGESLTKLIPARFRNGHPSHVSRFHMNPKTRSMGAGRELFGLQKQGTEVPIEIGLNPIQTEKGLYTLASIIDITERKRAEERFRLVVEAAPYAMIMVDLAHKMTLVNRTAERLFGYSREELIGQSIELLVPKVSELFEGPKTATNDSRSKRCGVRKDSVEVPIEIGLNPIDTPDGTFTLTSIIDITERKRSEDDLRRSNADLEQFASIASHDLQEPLRMVASYTELLSQRYKGKLDEKAEKYIFFAVDGAKRMQRLVADLLAYSRVGSQGKPLVPVLADSVARGVLSTLGNAIRNTRAEVTIDPLPMVLGDELQLHQLFQNLIGNALKFHGKSAPKIHMTASRDGPRWVFAVRDNGIGIDMQYADKIFSMFQRLHERDKYDGNGIGLAIAKRTVERHGGTIWLESTLDVGTTFYFTLVAAPQASESL